MKAFAITNPGLEVYSAKEIEELLKVKTKTDPSVILFEADEQKLAELCYKSQSLIKLCSLLEQIKLVKISDLKIKTDFTKIISKNKTYKVKAVCIGSSISSQELQPILGEIIHEQFKGKIKVSMDNPDYIVYVYVFGSKCYIGIDYCGFDLSKRDYRVFANPRSFHANINYILLKIAELKEKETLLDPFCLSGETGIEAALYLTKRSPNYFGKKNFAFNKFMKFNFDKADKEIKKTKSRIVLSSPAMSDVKCAQKNAKIASVEKSIEFTRQDIEWIDFKFKKKGSIDKIVSNIPCPSANMYENKLKRVYDDLFFQIKELLSKKGKVVLLGKNLIYLKKLAKNVKLTQEIKFKNGQEDLEIAVFER